LINTRSSAGPRRSRREWREKSDWSKNIPECYPIIHPNKTEENYSHFLFSFLHIPIKIVYSRRAESARERPEFENPELGSSSKKPKVKFS
jgi:hypothetical protein